MLFVCVILPENCHDLAVGAQRSPAVNQIRQKFPCLRIAEMNRFASAEGFKVSECAHSQLPCLRRSGRIAEIIDFMSDLFHGHRLHDIAAGMDAHRFTGIFAVAGGKDNVDAGTGFLESCGQLDPVYRLHRNIQKCDIRIVPAPVFQRFGRIAERNNLGIRHRFLDGSGQSLQSRLFIVYCHDLHCDTPAPVCFNYTPACAQNRYNVSSSRR